MKDLSDVDDAPDGGESDQADDAESCVSLTPSPVASRCSTSLGCSLQDDLQSEALLPLCTSTPSGTCGTPTSSGRTSVTLPPLQVRSRSSGALTCARLALTATARFGDVRASIELAAGQGEQLQALPEILPLQVPAIAQFRSSGSIAGNLRVNTMPPIPFGVQVKSTKAHGDRENFVGREGRQRATVAHGEDLKAGSGFSVKGEGIVVEVSITNGFEADMSVIVRQAKKKELTRLAQQEALIKAMERKKYSTLHAQITKARMRKVELGLIDQAERILRSIKMPEGTYLNHRDLSKVMRWKRTTSTGGAPIVEPCEASESCQCNLGYATSGEELTVTEGVVQEALGGIAPADVDADKWLFQSLVRAAYSVPEGCVWKSGGKFILSNEERNQSVTAIVNLLERDNSESPAGKAIRALVEYTERQYQFQVTAIQLNFHPNEKTYHKQHRDIHGAGQKGGINCTCTFLKCQGSVCYSLGSSRQVLCSTITDSRSKYQACGEDCTGQKVYYWMHSGSAMFFNDKWNANHTHGVPPCSEPCGPRISVAMLCA